MFSIFLFILATLSAYGRRKMQYKCNKKWIRCWTLLLMLFLRGYWKLQLGKQGFKNCWPLQERSYWIPIQTSLHFLVKTCSVSITWFCCWTLFLSYWLFNYVPSNWCQFLVITLIKSLILDSEKKTWRIYCLWIKDDGIRFLGRLKSFLRLYSPWVATNRKFTPKF